MTKETLPTQVEQKTKRVKMTTESSSATEETSTTEDTLEIKLTKELYTKANDLFKIAKDFFIEQNIKNPSFEYFTQDNFKKWLKDQDHETLLNFVTLQAKCLSLYDKINNLSNDERSKTLFKKLKIDEYNFKMDKDRFLSGDPKKIVTYSLEFRNFPENSPFMVVAGIEKVKEQIETFKRIFGGEKLTKENDPVAYQTREMLFTFLRNQKLPNGDRKYPDSYIDYLKTYTPTVSIESVSDGDVITGACPIFTIRSDEVFGTFIEASLLANIGVMTATATKSAEIFLATGGKKVANFGLRRGMDDDRHDAAAIGGGVSAAADISRSLEGEIIIGTNAHSKYIAINTRVLGYIECNGQAAQGEIFDDNTKSTVSSMMAELFPNRQLSNLNEQEKRSLATRSSERYVMLADQISTKGNTTHLVDSYGNDSGIESAIFASTHSGIKLGSIRIDSGDVIESYKLAKEKFRAVRERLKEEGKTDAEIENLLPKNIRIFFTNGLGPDDIVRFRKTMFEEIFKDHPKAKQEYLDLARASIDKDKTFKGKNLDDAKKDFYDRFPEWDAVDNFVSYAVGTQLAQQVATKGLVAKPSFESELTKDGEVLENTGRDIMKMGEDQKEEDGQIFPGSKASYPMQDPKTICLYNDKNKVVGYVRVDLALLPGLKEKLSNNASIAAEDLKPIFNKGIYNASDKSKLAEFPNFSTAKLMLKEKTESTKKQNIFGNAVVDLYAAGNRANQNLLNLDSMPIEVLTGLETIGEAQKSKKLTKTPTFVEGTLQEKQTDLFRRNADPKTTKAPSSATRTSDNNTTNVVLQNHPNQSGQVKQQGE